MSKLRVVSLLLVIILTAPISIAARAEQDCGIVDAIDYPIDSISIDHDDFGMFRAAGNGLHTGIDMAFDRYGDAVRASARGRVTFSDPAGWDTEKGVVILEHTFPDHSTFFTLYGHMEQTNGHTFPHLGDCVAKGDVIGSVGHPLHSAPHLHYEIRKMRASTGGPGYWSVDPLDGGWMHPIDFTEAWQLRFNPAFRAAFTAGSNPIAPPLLQTDGSAIFAEQAHLEQRSKNDESIWRLDVAGLTGIVNLPDGRVLGRTADDQIIIIGNGRFVGVWKADRPLRSPPLRFGNQIVFLTADNGLVAYDTLGKVLWQSAPFSDRIARYVQSGDLLALSAEQAGSYKLWVVNAAGKTVYEGTAPVPITPVANPKGLIVLVGTQVSLFGADLTLKPLVDVGQALGRNSQIAFDPRGNLVIYPGQGQRIFAFTASGGLRWQAILPLPPTQPPLLSIGSGCLVYALTADGSLLIYQADDGLLRGSTALYAGGIHGHVAARFLTVSSNDQVQFSAGYLSVATLDGPTLANTSDCPKL